LRTPYTFLRETNGRFRSTLTSCYQLIYEDVSSCLGVSQSRSRSAALNSYWQRTTTQNSPFIFVCFGFQTD